MSPSPPRDQPRCGLPVAIIRPPDTLMLVVLSLPGCWRCCHSHLLLGDGFMFHFSQFMPIIIIVIQHDRITPRHYKQVSTVLLTCLCSDLILSVSIQPNYDSIINFANYNSSSVPSSPFIGAPYLLVVSTTYNISTRLHNWRGLSFVLCHLRDCVHISACSVQVGGMTPGTRLSVQLLGTRHRRLLLSLV